MGVEGGYTKARGYSPGAISCFGVNGSFINCTSSHEGRINICFSQCQLRFSKLIKERYLAKTFSFLLLCLERINDVNQRSTFIRLVITASRRIRERKSYLRDAGYARLCCLMECSPAGGGRLWINELMVGFFHLIFGEDHFSMDDVSST